MRIAYLVLALGLVNFSYGVSYASSCHATDASGEDAVVVSDKLTQAASKAGNGQDSAEPVNVNNKVCPVMGEAIDETSKVLYEYKGKVYSFCCPACVEQFKADPEKYIDAIKAKEGNISEK